MDEQHLTDEYLARFPSTLRTVLSERKFKEKFIRCAKEDYAPVIPVYRALRRENEIHEDDFLNNVEEHKLYNQTPFKRQSLEINAVS